MRYLLYTAILGFGCWTVSEVLEIVQGGYSPAVYYLTAAYHVLAGLGIWGLYKRQTPQKNVFNLASTAIASVAYLSFTRFPIQVMRSGLSMADFVNANPIYKIGGLVWFVGMLLFSVSVFRTGYFPRWTGVIMVIGTVSFVATPLLGWPTLLVNVTNIIFAVTVIYISILGLKTVVPTTTDTDVYAEPRDGRIIDQ
ncbi:MAG TPA: hypothetical protein VMM38_02445 [Aridibacter sp.]|nr:hypothetical protein [Aridibacter sp.]